jgi:hypothetical protein
MNIGVLQVLEPIWIMHVKCSFLKIYPPLTDMALDLCHLSLHV